MKQFRDSRFYVNDDGVIFKLKGDEMVPVTTSKNDRGYLRFPFSQGVWRKVHQVVCEVFHGPRPEGGYEASHLDENNMNNNPKNLAWETRLQNIRRRYPNAPSEADKLAMSMMLLRGCTQAYIASVYGCHRDTVGKVNKKLLAIA